MTTPVGSIRIDLTIDGDDLWGNVATQIAPVMAGLERLTARLDSLQNSFRSTGREAQQSMARVATAMRTAEPAINSVTRAWDRQTSAIARNTAARIANANAPTGGGPGTRDGGGLGSGGDYRRFDNRTIHNVVNNVVNNYSYDNRTINNNPPPPGPNPGPRPGGPGGGRRGGRRGVGGMITSPAGLSGISLAASALPALATGLTNVVGSVQQLVQSGLVLPGLYAGAAASIGTAVIGFKGVGDAVKALRDATDDPKKMEAALKVLEDMAPAARDLAKTTATFLDGPGKEFQKFISQTMLTGFADDLQNLSDKALPRVQTGMGKVAGAWRGTLKELTGSLGSEKSLSLMDQIFGNTAEGQKRANAAIGPLISGFGTLAKEGSYFLPRLGDALAKVSERFDNWVTKNSENGNMFRWIDEGLNGLRALGNSVLNIGKIFTGLTKAAGSLDGSLSGDGGFLGGLERFTDKWANFVNSDIGQEKLSAFFKDGGDLLGRWADLLGDLGPVLGSIVQGFQTWGEVLFPILEVVGSLLNTLNQIPGLLETIVVGFLAFRTLTGVIGGLTTAIGGRGGRGGLVGALGSLKGLSGIAGAGLTFTGAADQAQNGVDVTNSITTIGGAALLGAAVGGPWGAAIGTLIGAGVTLFNDSADRLREAKDKWLDKWEEDRANPDRPGNPTDANAITGRDRILQPSLNTPVLQGDLTEKLRSGQLPGFTLGADGQVRDRSGRVVNLPGGLLDPSALPKAPVTPPTLSPEVQAQVTQGTPIAAGAPAAAAALEGTAIKAKMAFDNVELLSHAVETLPTGEVVLKENTPEAIKRVEDLGYAVKKLPTGQVQIQVQYMLDGRPISRSQLMAPIRVGAFPGDSTNPNLGGRADGGVLPGWSPGRDNMLVPMSGGEGVLIPEAVRGLGGSAALYAINSAFRRGLSRRGYADGGVVNGGAAGFDAITGDDTSVMGLLKQIRDLLAGKAGGPLPATADAVAGTGTTGGGVTGDRWANGQKRDPGREMLEAAISALGGDPAKFLPPLPAEAGAMSYGSGGPAGFAAMGGGYTPSRRGARSGGPSGSKSGLQAATSNLFDVIGQYFPEIATIGGVRKDAHPDHPSGRALDIMIPGGSTRGGANPEGKALGDQIWAFMEANQEKLGIDMSGSLWRTDTGGDHYNHIHARTSGVGGMAGYDPSSGLIPPGEMGMDGMDVGGGSLGYTGGGPVPVYVVNNPNAASGDAGLGGPLIDGLAAGATQAAQNVGERALDAALGVGNRALPTDVATMDELTRERNPAAFAAAFGLQVGDYGREGIRDPLMRNDGPGYDAAGRLFSDTGALTDRTSTSKEAVEEARHQQLLDIMSQVRDNGTEQVLQPIMKTAISEGIGAIKEQVTAQIGSGLGQTAGPLMAEPIASAVRSAMPTSTSDGGAGSALGAAGQAASGIFMAQGGPVFGGTLGVDSVPIMAQHGEFMLNTSDVRRMGGPAGVERFRSALAAGKVKGFATGGGVKADGVALGAEFFGVSEVPIIGPIVGILVSLLLSLIGLEIEQRDTMNELTGEARQFRGDFKEFDAQGRLFNDTTGLSERTGSSEQVAADERIRILKIVISELIKFIIQKIVIPITQAVGNAAIQAGATAAGAAVNTQAPGAGGIVSSLISGAGQAALDVGIDAWSNAAGVLTPLITDVVGEALVGIAPNLFRDIFGGKWLAQIFGPRSPGVSGMAGGLAGLFAALVGGAATDSLFDEGGMARGRGYLQKAVSADELVLSPVQTDMFGRLVSALERNGLGSSRPTTIHAPFTVIGGETAGQQAHDRLLALMD